MANLQPSSNPTYADPKKRRHIMVTDPGWQKAKAIAKEKFGLSISELVEQTERITFEVIEASNREKDS